MFLLTNIVSSFINANLDLNEILSYAFYLKRVKISSWNIYWNKTHNINLIEIHSSYVGRPFYIVSKSRDTLNCPDILISYNINLFSDLFLSYIIYKKWKKKILFTVLTHETAAVTGKNKTSWCTNVVIPLTVYVALWSK